MRGDTSANTSADPKPVRGAELALLNNYQHDFPICTRPFAAIAQDMGTDEADVIAQFTAWLEQGRITRVGPVFAPQRVGVSTLAAINVPPDRLTETAALVSAFAEVNHNYAREHAYNLWFVATAPDLAHLDHVLSAIAQQCNAPVLRLPMLEQYHIDLGFSLHDAPCKHHAHSAQTIVSTGIPPKQLTTWQRQLIGAMQGGLALCQRPYQALADGLGCAELEVLHCIRTWLADGTLKRFGVVVRHHEMGYVANAMVVHDVPDAQVSELGQRLGQHPAVTLCYRRPRVKDQWRYNLFCMLHGRNRSQVEQQITKLREDYALQDYPHAVLFSRDRFKQQGARYTATPLAVCTV